MIYQDKENVYIKFPRHFAAMISKSVVQACLSMKQDNISANNSIEQSEIVLLQVANLINNAKFLQESQSAVAKAIFDENSGEEDDKN